MLVEESELTKDPSVHALLARLAERLGVGAFRVRDYWDADLWAVGIVSPQNDQVLAYINTEGRADGPYFLALELPPEPGSDAEYRDGGSFADISFDELTSRVAAHLADEPRQG